MSSYIITDSNRFFRGHFPRALFFDNNNDSNITSIRCLISEHK